MQTAGVLTYIVASLFLAGKINCVHSNDERSYWPSQHMSESVIEYAKNQWSLSTSHSEAIIVIVNNSQYIQHSTRHQEVRNAVHTQKEWQNGTSLRTEKRDPNPHPQVGQLWLCTKFAVVCPGWRRTGWSEQGPHTNLENGWLDTAGNQPYCGWLKKV